MKVNQGTITSLPSCLIYFLSVFDIMEKHGITRNYWEGGIQTEGIVNHMKSLASRVNHVPVFA